MARRLILAALVAVILGGLYAIASSMDLADALTADTMRKERLALAATLSALCPVTVAQYGPSERWNPRPPHPICADVARALPNHILTSPMEPQ